MSFVAPKRPFKAKCPNCGALVFSTDDRCMACGYRLVPATPPAHSNQPIPPTGLETPPARPRSGLSQLATAGIVLGALGFFCLPIVFGPLGMAFGIAAIVQRDTTGGIIAILISLIPTLIAVFGGALFFLSLLAGLAGL